MKCINNDKTGVLKAITVITYKKVEGNFITFSCFFFVYHVDTYRKKKWDCVHTAENVDR